MVSLRLIYVRYSGIRRRLDLVEEPEIVPREEAPRRNSGILSLSSILSGVSGVCGGSLLIDFIIISIVIIIRSIIWV